MTELKPSWMERWQTSGLVPWPHVIAQDLTLGNPEWAKNPQMASLKKVELRLSPDRKSVV